jgi:hypothetical protein
MLLYTTASSYIVYEDAVIWTSEVNMTYSDAHYYIPEGNKQN